MPKEPRTVEEHMHHIRTIELPQYPTIPSKPTISYMATESGQFSIPATRVYQLLTKSTFFPPSNGSEAVTPAVPSRPAPPRSQTTGPLRINKSRAAPARSGVTSRVPLPSPIKVRPTPTTIEAQRVSTITSFSFSMCSSFLHDLCIPTSYIALDR